jgi:hypothetical protein
VSEDEVVAETAEHAIGAAVAVNDVCPRLP